MPKNVFNTKCKKKKKVYILDILLKQTIQSAVQVIKVVWIGFFSAAIKPRIFEPRIFDSKSLTYTYK